MRYEMVCCDHGPLFKLAKGDAPLVDRERPAVRRLRFRLRALMRTFLRERAEDVARTVVLLRYTLQKTVEDDVARILQSLDTSGWQQLIGQLAPILERLVREGAEAGFGQVGMVADVERMLTLTNDFAITYARERAGELITQIGESTRRMIRDDIVRALEAGDSNDVLATVLRQGYAFSPERAEMIARTETAYADVEGNLEAYRQSNVVQSKKWITGAGCCDLCDELNGTIVPLAGAFPGGRPGPPLHPNCRCDIVPVLSKPKKPS
jgi:SPP1 gp7 family putative phage head morphogenesis protein